MKNKTLWQVLVSLLLAIVAGYFTSPNLSFAGISLVSLYGLIGQLFLNALTLVVVPLVCSSIITGTARMGADGAFKSMGAKAFSCFIGSTLSAILIGYALVSLIQPGAGHEGSLASQASLEIAHVQESQTAFQKVEQILFRLVPTNIIAAASQGQMLGLIVFSMIIGFFINKIDAQPAAAILTFFHGIFQLMMKITQLVMKALPIGVFALVAKIVSTTGLESIRSVAAFSGVVFLGLCLCLLILFPLMLKIVGRASPLAHFKAMTPALVTAFSTSSSAATMPVSIECLETRAGVPARICGFAIPLGTAMNMPGTALHVCVGVFFIAQVYGISLSWSTQAIIILMTLLTSFGIAGIPSGSLFALVTVLGMAGLPAEGVALILAVERLIDMCRTTVNVFGNSCCAVVMAKKAHPVPDPLPAV